LRLAAEYEVLLTQRWVLQPRVEANLYGKEDPELGIGRGLSSAAYGVRLRYEFTRHSPLTSGSSATRVSAVLPASYVVPAAMPVKPGSWPVYAFCSKSPPF
jgi:hypothetical protein